MLLRVGTRGSRLSVIQTDMIVEKLKRKTPSLQVERKIIATSGDLDRTTPLFSLNQKGIFEKEVDQAVVDGKVDFAVHSMKDVPTDLHRDLMIGSVPERGATADVLVSKDMQKLNLIQNGKRVGTSSLLRVAQLRRVRPGLRTDPIRGNVDTRIEKVDRGEYDAVILAEAGVARLGLMGRVAERLSIEDFMPAPGQGALAIVARRDDPRITEVLRTVEHPATRAETSAERSLVRVLGGGCKVPIGGLASTERGIVRLSASILSSDGQDRLTASGEGSFDNSENVGTAVGEDLLEKGAKRIEQTWRTIYS